MGSVSSSDRPTLRKAGGRASVDERLAMESLFNQVEFLENSDISTM
jgi:hypothetical protein